MAKRVYLSKRVSLPFSVKMDASQAALLKKEQRRQGRSKVRQSLFINDYIFYKHHVIYQQAAQLYNELNEIYPKKPDLRRTEEFKNWKLDVTGQPRSVKRKTKKRHPYTFPSHANIPMARCIDPHVNFTVVVPPESPRGLAESSDHQNVKKVMELRIPLMCPPAETPRTVTEEVLEPSLCAETVTEEVLEPSLCAETVTEEVLEPSLCAETVTEEVLEPSLCAETVTEEVLEPSLYTETIQTVTEEVLEPSLYTETIQTVTEEVLEEGISSLEPSLHEEVSPEIIQKIVEELSQDPGLKDILTSFEEHKEFKQLGMDLDMPDDRLENELENLIFW